MKNYIITILIVLGLGLLTSPLVSNAKADVIPEIDSETQEVTDEITFENKTQIEKANITEIATKAEITTPVRAYTAKTATTSVANGHNYTVTRSSSSIVKSPTYSDIYRTGNLVYAHNSSNLFGNLKSLSIGSTFTLTENGVTTTYRVSGVEYFKKIAVSNGEDLAKCVGGITDNCSGRWMTSIVKNALYHNVALMTCAGQSYGNGDASHRLVILADRV